MLAMEGKAVVFDSQEAAGEGIRDGTVVPGSAVIIRWEGPKGGPGMQEMLSPTSYLKSMGLDLTCFLITDGRFSGGTRGACFGHVSPEAAAGGLIGVVQNGDRISYDISKREITLHVSVEEIAMRHTALKGSIGKPDRDREVSSYLREYAHFVTSADKGAVQIVP